MFDGIVSEFLGFFKGKVSVDVFENIFIEEHFSRPFRRYIILFCSSNIRCFLHLYIPGENEKSLRLSGFYLVLTPSIFFKIVFLENYDRYKAETYWVYYLWLNLSIGIEPPNVNFQHGKMICPILKHGKICYNG